MARLRDPYVVVGLGVAAAGGALLAVVSLLPADDRDALLFEIAKAAIAVFPFAFFSVVVADLVRRRDAERVTRDRHRETRRTFRVEAIAAYNQTKATRRRLRGAGLRPDSGIMLTDRLLDTLDNQMGSLIESQLTLERLKREMEAPSAPFGNRAVIRVSLEALEKYMNTVVKDWEEGRPGLAAGVGATVFGTWPTYAGYVAASVPARADGGPAEHFRQLEEALLRDLTDELS